MSGREVDRILKNIYYNLKSPQAYTSRVRVYRAAKKIRPAIRRRDVDSWFRKQPTATLHKPVRYRFTRNRTVVMSVGDQYQADLCDMTNLARYNDGHKFLLTCTDLFSRRAWAKAIKSKQGKNVARVLEEIFRERVCKRLQTDKGTEFLNVHVRKLLKSLNIKLWISKNEDVKAALVERFIELSNLKCTNTLRLIIPNGTSMCSPTWWTGITIPCTPPFKWLPPR